VDANRDDAVVHALEGVPEFGIAPYSHLLFFDTDMVWPTDVLRRMLRHHALDAVVAGLYFLRGKPWGPVAFRHSFTQEGSRVTQFYHDEDAHLGTELREEDVVGMGCTLIPTAIIRALGPRPWFAYRDNDAGWPCVTEDVPFCQAVRAAGFPIYLDPTVKCKHLGLQEYDEAWHRRWLESAAASDGRLTVTMEPVGG
jgi:GT2 family glycosyltransferase